MDWVFQMNFILWFLLVLMLLRPSRWRWCLQWFSVFPVLLRLARYVAPRWHFVRRIEKTSLCMKRSIDLHLSEATEKFPGRVWLGLDTRHGSTLHIYECIMMNKANMGIVVGSTLVFSYFKLQNSSIIPTDHFTQPHKLFVTSRNGSMDNSCHNQRFQFMERTPALVPAQLLGYLATTSLTVPLRDENGCTSIGDCFNVYSRL